MAVIAARKPYYITHFGQQLDVDLYIYDYDATKPTSPQYTLKKLSFADGVDEDLRLDISPFIRDYFDHSLATDDLGPADGGTQMPANMYLKVDAVVNTVEENHTALDGFQEMGQSTKEGICDYIYDTSYYVTFKKGSFTTVRYTAHDGTIENHSLNSTTNGYLKIRPSSPSPEPGKQFTMSLIGSKTATYTFKDVCAYESGENFYSVGFVNKWGLVEWTSMTGASDKTLSVEGNEFTSADSRSAVQYNRDGKYKLKLNTGFIEGDRLEFLESIMMSESIWIYGAVGSHTDQDRWTAVMTDKSSSTKQGRNNRLVNYTFTFEITPSIIYG